MPDLTLGLSQDSVGWGQSVGQDREYWQTDLHIQASLGEIPRCYAAVVQMNGTIGDGETEPSAASLAFSGATHAIKRFEHLREFGRGNPWSLVDYVNNRQILSCSVIELQADFHARRLARVPNGVTNNIFNRASQQRTRTVNQAGIRVRKNHRALCGRALKAGVRNDVREKK